MLARPAPAGPAKELDNAAPANLRQTHQHQDPLAAPSPCSTHGVADRSGPGISRDWHAAGPRWPSGEAADRAGRAVREGPWNRYAAKPAQMGIACATRTVSHLMFRVGQNLDEQGLRDAL
jgi:hypothetical protein